MGIKQIEQFSDIILRILRFLTESSGVTKLELFERFPHCGVSAGVPSPVSQEQFQGHFVRNFRGKVTRTQTSISITASTLTLRTSERKRGNLPNCGDYQQVEAPIFLWLAPLSFDWSPHLRLTCGPAGNRTTTGTLSACQRRGQGPNELLPFSQFRSVGNYGNNINLKQDGVRICLGKDVGR